MEQETENSDGNLTKPMMIDALNNRFLPLRANIYQVYNLIIATKKFSFNSNPILVRL
jgi:hypothetical protein